jgi:hypothetical protein
MIMSISYERRTVTEFAPLFAARLRRDASHSATRPNRLAQAFANPCTKDRYQGSQIQVAMTALSASADLSGSGRDGSYGLCRPET